MSLKRAYVSYNHNVDTGLKNLLVDQTQRPDSPFLVDYWSFDDPSANWKMGARRRIRASGVVIVLCGTYMRTCVGVAVEVALAQEEEVPYFLLAGCEGATKPTTARYKDRLHAWTWDNLKDLVVSAR